MVADDHSAGNKRYDEWAPTRPPTRREGNGGAAAAGGRVGGGRGGGGGCERGVRGGSWMTGGGSVVMATHRSAAATRIESSRGHIAPRRAAPHHTTPHHTADTCACGSRVRDGERKKRTEGMGDGRGVRKREKLGSAHVGIVTRLPRFDPRGKAKSNERRRHGGGRGVPPWGRG